MKRLQIRNLMKPKKNDMSQYFFFLPYVSMAMHEGGTYAYIGWLNICVALKVKSR